MQFVAKARYLRFSPYKLRPLVDVIRGKNVAYALHWLATYPVKRAIPITKIIESAAANAKNLQGLNAEGLVIKDIRVDQGPIVRYFKPGAMGRANIQRKRFSHMSVIVEPITRKED
ncbi:50S ribosomal protein L22 [Candidatus Dependentiae bacterium Noda2021]|nr:50S ribosomal protein L22 [Candidatus Dependentiae bacterium Noda2021]